MSYSIAETILYTHDVTEGDDLKLTYTSSFSSQGDNEPDLYGQTHPHETSALIADKLLSLEKELLKIPPKEKEAFLRAQKECPDLIDNEHQLRFLRCEVFNADRAATRIARYWKKRLQLFGEDIAFRPITITNIFQHEPVALSLGFIRLVSKSDTTGRPVIFTNPQVFNSSKYTVKEMTRAIWYMLESSIEIQSGQQKGVVFLGDLRNCHISQFDKTLVRMNLDHLQGCLPIRVSAFHICHAPSFFKFIFPFLKMCLGARLRKRLHFHFGKDKDVLMKLNKYGLTSDIIPKQLGGKMIVDHDLWIKDRSAYGL